MQWYYAEDEKQVGPVNEETFRGLVGNGTITARTYVWNETMSGWEFYGNLDGGASAKTLAGQAAGKGDTLFCVECGKPYPAGDLAQFGNARVCAGCKPVFVQKIKEGVSVGSALDYAGFWIRLGAKIIDLFILWAVQMVLYLPVLFSIMPNLRNGIDNPESASRMMIINVVVSLLQFAVNIGFGTWFIGKFAATPGKMVCKLQVVTAEGGKVGYGRAMGRVFAEIISGVILAIGYLMAAFDSQKRTLHDHICSTRVVRKVT